MGIPQCHQAAFASQAGLLDATEGWGVAGHGASVPILGWTIVPMTGSVVNAGVLRKVRGQIVDA